MKIQKFTHSPFQENTYIVWNEETKETIIIDPSCLSKSEELEIENFVISNDLNVKYLFNTHGHLDHLFGNSFIRSRFSPVHFAPEKDMPLFERAEEQAKSFGLKMKKSPNPDFYFNESEILNIIGTEIKLIFTPGHTPGEFCIYFPNENICFTGDVLFKESIGRTDLWGGNYETLMNSINSKLLILPDETTIYAGHGEKSTIQYEKLNNPFLQ